MPFNKPDPWNPARVDPNAGRAEGVCAEHDEATRQMRAGNPDALPNILGIDHLKEEGSGNGTGTHDSGNGGDSTSVTGEG